MNSMNRKMPVVIFRLNQYGWRLAVVILLGVAKPVFSQGSPPPPFKPQKNGGISMKDIIKLTQRPPAKDRITDEELQRIKDSNPIRYTREFKKNLDNNPHPVGDLYADSKIIGIGEFHTVVPETAVLFVPEKLQGHILKSPRGKLVLWPHFLKQNLNWIQPREVSLKTAQGEVPLSESTQKSLVRSTKIVVAVYRGFPISVLSPTSDESASKPTVQ